MHFGSASPLRAPYNILHHKHNIGKLRTLSEKLESATRRNQLQGRKSKKGMEMRKVRGEMDNNIQIKK